MLRFHPRAAAVAALLALSLGCNLWLGIRVWTACRQAAPVGRPPAPASHPPPSRPQNITTSRAAPDPAWTALGPEADLKNLVARLRAADIEPDTIRALARALVWERMGRRRDEVYYPEEQPFWKHRIATKAQLVPIEHEMNALLCDITGESIDLFEPTTNERTLREELYGQLSESKIDAIQKTNVRYRSLRENISPDAPDRAEQLALLKQAEWQELASALTPAELADFQKRSAAPSH